DTEETSDKSPSPETPWPARGSCEIRQPSALHRNRTHNVLWKWFWFEPLLTWNEASRFCYTQDGHLPVLNTDLARNAFVTAGKAHFNSSKNLRTGVWIGLHQEKSGAYAWEYDCSHSTNIQLQDSANHTRCGRLNIAKWDYHATHCVNEKKEVVCEIDEGLNLIRENADSEEACKQRCLDYGNRECVIAVFNSSATSQWCKIYTKASLVNADIIKDIPDDTVDNVTAFVRDCFKTEAQGKTDDDGLGSDTPWPAGGRCDNHSSDPADSEKMNFVPAGVKLAAATCDTSFNLTYSSSEGSLDVNVVFVIDASDSISEENFTLLGKAIFDFITPVMRTQNETSPSDVKVGFVLFNETAVSLDLIVDPQTLKQTLNGYNQQGGIASTSTGIGRGLDLLLSDTTSARKVMVVVTAGDSIDSCATRQQALEARRQGVKVIAVGMGDNVTSTELLRISGSPCRVKRSADFSRFPCISLQRKLDHGAPCCRDGECGDNMRCHRDDTQSMSTDRGNCSCRHTFDLIDGICVCQTCLSEEGVVHNQWSDAISACEDVGSHLDVFSTEQKLEDAINTTICPRSQNESVFMLLASSTSSATDVKNVEGNSYNCFAATPTTTEDTPPSTSPTTDTADVTTSVLSRAWTSISTYFTQESTTSPETPSTAETTTDEPGPNCENETSNYQLTLDRVMSSANCIEGKRFCKEDGMLLPVVESPQHLHTLARCLCPPDERIPHYKRPKGFHVRLRLPEGTTVNRWENITGGFRYICREFETWNVYLHTCPGNYTVYKCSVDCTGQMEVSITPVPFLCQKSGRVLNRTDCPPRRRCRPGENITAQCDPGKFLVKKCNCLHINPNDTRNNSEEVMKQLMEAIFNELMLNATKLGKTARKRTSASDERPSATYAGYLGIAVLVVIAGAIVISDLPRLFKCPHC
ncbi:hypothetical protein BaRGS_00031175, partial [Batillaria attramentaria]